MSIGWLLTTALVLIGCQDAKTWVKDTKAGYDELGIIARQVNELALAAKQNDFRDARRFAKEAEKYLDTRVLSWTVKLLAIEEKDGRDAARAELQRISQQEDASKSEREALEEMEKFYRNRTARISDVLAVMAAVSVEEKFGGHGTAAAFMSIYEGLRDTAPFSEVYHSDDASTNSATIANLTNSTAPR